MGGSVYGICWQANVWKKSPGGALLHLSAVWWANCTSVCQRKYRMRCFLLSRKKLVCISLTHWWRKWAPYFVKIEILCWLGVSLCRVSMWSLAVQKECSTFGPGKRVLKSPTLLHTSSVSITAPSCQIQVSLLENDYKHTYSIWNCFSLLNSYYMIW